MAARKFERPANATRLTDEDIRGDEPKPEPTPAETKKAVDEIVKPEEKAKEPEKPAAPLAPPPKPRKWRVVKAVVGTSKYGATFEFAAGQIVGENEYDIVWFRHVAGVEMEEVK